MHLQSNSFPLLGECAIQGSVIIMYIKIKNKRPVTEFHAVNQQNLAFLWSSLVKTTCFHMLLSNWTTSVSVEILLKCRFLSHPQEKENRLKMGTQDCHKAALFKCTGAKVERFHWPLLIVSCSRAMPVYFHLVTWMETWLSKAFMSSTA